MNYASTKVRDKLFCFCQCSYTQYKQMIRFLPYFSLIRNWFFYKFKKSTVIQWHGVSDSNLIIPSCNQNTYYLLYNSWVWLSYFLMDKTHSAHHEPWVYLDFTVCNHSAFSIDLTDVDVAFIQSETAAIHIWQLSPKKTSSWSSVNMEPRRFLLAYNSEILIRIPKSD